MKKYFLALLLLGQLAFITEIHAQNIAINGTGNLPDTSAMLDISSTNKGFLAPRMTTVQQNAIPLPANGLLIFNTTDNVFKVNTGTTAVPVWTPLATGSGATTNLLSSSVNTMTSTTNGVAATAPIVNSVSNNSSVNTLTTTVNGVAATGVSIINSNTLGSAVNTMTSTTNGVAATAPIVNSVSNTSSANTLSTTINGVAGTGVAMINSNALSLSGVNLTATINGIASAALSLSPAVLAASTNTLSSSVNTLTSTANGVAATAPIVNSVSNTSSANTLSTTINGIAGTGVSMINSNALSLSGVNLTATINGIASAALSLSPAVLAASTNTLSSSVNTMTSTANGVAATAPIVNSVSNTSSANTLSTTINGVAGTGVAMINSNALSLSGTNLTSTVNGIASSALNLAPAFAAATWAIAGNAGITQPATPTTYGTTPFTAGENFLGTTDTKDLVLGTRNLERLRILQSNGYIGIGTSTPTKPLDLVSSVPGVGLVKLQNTDVTGYSSIDIWSNLVQIGNIGYANTGGTYPNAFYFATNTTNSMVFATNNTERIRVDGSNGYVGIATTAPTSTFEVNGSFATEIYKSINNTAITLSNIASVYYITHSASLTLPAANTCANRRYIIVNRSGANRTISSFTSLAGAGTTTIANSTSIEIISDGANWLQIK